MTLALLAALTVKSSALLALALAAALSLSRASASLRHWVLAVATCCTLALPVFAVLLPSWDLPAAHEDAGGSLAPTTAVSVAADTEAVVVGARVHEAASAVRPLATAVMISLLRLFAA